MTNPSKRELAADIDELQPADDADPLAGIELCESWKDDCGHDEHSFTIDFTDIDT